MSDVLAGIVRSPDGSNTNPKASSDLAPRQAGNTEGNNLITSKYRLWPPDRLTGARPFSTGVVEAGDHALANHTPIQLSHCRDHGEHGLSHWRRAIESFLVGDEVDSECSKPPKRTTKLLDAPAAS